MSHKHVHIKVDEGGKGAVCWLRESEKTEKTWGKEIVGTNSENIFCRSEKERIHSMYNKTIIRFGFVISRIIKVSVRVISLSLRLRLITPTSTLIILDITKTSSNNSCFLAWGFMFVLLCSFTKKKTGSVFPAFRHATFHHALITYCNVSRAGYIAWCITIGINLILVKAMWPRINQW